MIPEPREFDAGDEPPDGYRPGERVRILTESTSHAALDILDFGAVAASVDAAPARRYLFRSIWPHPTHGMLAAESKAQKTWDEIDAAVSVAGARPFLGIYDCEVQGGVLMFLGEGGQERMVRRIRAVARSKGVNADTLPLRVCFRVPHLSDSQHLTAIRQELEDHPAVLVIIDPMYLAARGAKSSQLVEMGALLEEIQHITQAAGASLLIVHHHNRKEGKGRDRMSGAGPAEWGRVLISVHVEQRHTEADGTSNVTRTLDLVGDEIPDTTLRVRRRIRAIVPGDLSSDFEYSVEEVEPDSNSDASDLPPAARRILAILRAAEGPLSVRKIGDELARDGNGSPLRTRTIQDSAKKLEESLRATRTGTPAGDLWQAVRAAEGTQSAF